MKIKFRSKICGNAKDLQREDYERISQQKLEATNIAGLSNELRQRLVAVWKDLEQHVIDSAIDQWRRRLRACVRAKGGHFEHSL